MTAPTTTPTPTTRPADRTRTARVTVAVPTFRRPATLDRLLTALRSQLGEALAAGTATEVGVLVIDNDPQGSAAEVVAAHPGVAYRPEPRPGLAAVRNQALRSARDSDVLVFIDDDERPAPGWLARLLATWQATAAVGVTGPVVSELPTDLDPWITAGGFFDRRYRRGTTTGTRIREAATSNLLVDLAAVRAADLWFDPEFGLSGGEDSLFTRRLAQVGPLVWCAEATVHDPVAVQRLSRSWVCRRALSSANSAARVDLALAGRTLRVRTRLATDGLARITAGSFQRLAGGLVRSERWRARGTRTGWRGYGLLLGAVGFSYLEYGRGQRWHWTLKATAPTVSPYAPREKEAAA